MTVLRIFRKFNARYFSLERVFAHLAAFQFSGGKIQNFSVPQDGAGLLDVIKNISAVLKLDAAVYHITGAVHYLAIFLPRSKTVLTIHDCVFLESNKGLKRFFLKKLFLDWPVKRAGIITTISEKSKQEIIQHTGCKAEKIHVIPNPVDPLIYFEDKPFNNTAPRYLFIGATPLKNLERVLFALKGLPGSLRLVGRFSDTQKELIHNSGIPSSIVSNLTDAEIAAEYAACDVVLFPSLYEGFGLPIIEAQKAGRVILTSELSPMKEVAGGGAMLVNPYDVESIRNGILKVVEDPISRDLLIQKGFDNVRSYAPEVVAEKYNQLYTKLLAKKGSN